ncbi:MAG: hypothetical protein QOF46_166, partial [Paraburkholderia sp.]|nr:hypothetical protein [Paraburkholderia sp.]
LLFRREVLMVHAYQPTLASLAPPYAAFIV